jgi:hypothetical protein
MRSGITGAGTAHMGTPGMTVGMDGGGHKHVGKLILSCPVKPEEVKVKMKSL